MALTVLAVAACGDDANKGGGGSGGEASGGAPAGGGGAGQGGAETFLHADLEWSQAVTLEVMLAQAASFCDGLETGGYDDWRLPTIVELRSLIVGCEVTVTGGTCNVPDACMSTECRDGACEGCSQQDLPPQGCFWPPEAEGSCGYYWSSDPTTNEPTFNWGVGFNGGHISSLLQTDVGSARCVRAP